MDSSTLRISQDHGRDYAPSITLPAIAGGAHGAIGESHRSRQRLAPSAAAAGLGAQEMHVAPPPLLEQARSEEYAPSRF